MNFKRLIPAAVIGAGFAAAIILAGSPTRADDTKPFDAKKTEAIQGIIKDYLLKNPEILREASIELKRREEAALEEALKPARQKALSQLYKEETPFSIGKGKITLVEFFDYNCGYCRRAFTDLQKLVESEKDFRIVFVELPVLSDESKFASLAAIASAKQGKYFEFHRALMNTSGAINEERVYKLGAEIGLDIEKLKADIKSPETEQILEKNVQIATAMGIQGTPAFFIGDEVIPGAPANLAETVKALIAQVREKGCSVC